ncbi:hypothetical protein F4775DRAFT_225364 [Biscogniauxia sp. FL1348]|nr:hypothetical protein F4775DRAFT_225364 [Biscogniauxia sp. FL1348]
MVYFIITILLTFDLRAGTEVQGHLYSFIGSSQERHYISSRRSAQLLNYDFHVELCYCWRMTKKIMVGNTGSSSLSSSSSPRWTSEGFLITRSCEIQPLLEA